MPEALIFGCVTGHDAARNYDMRSAYTIRAVPCEDNRHARKVPEEQVRDRRILLMDNLVVDMKVEVVDLGTQSYKSERASVNYVQGTKCLRY